MRVTAAMMEELTLGCEASAEEDWEGMICRYVGCVVLNTSHDGWNEYSNKNPNFFLKKKNRGCG